MEQEKILMVMDKIMDKLLELDAEDPKQWNTIMRCHKTFLKLSLELKQSKEE